MKAAPQISCVRFTRATEAECSTGLLGYLQCLIDGSIRIDGLVLRRTRSGGFTISYPCRTDAAGRRHALIRPCDDRTRRLLERQILAALDPEVLR